MATGASCLPAPGPPSRTLRPSSGSSGRGRPGDRPGFGSAAPGPGGTECLERRTAQPPGSGPLHVRELRLSIFTRAQPFTVCKAAPRTAVESAGCRARRGAGPVARHGRDFTVSGGANGGSDGTWGLFTVPHVTQPGPGPLRVLWDTTWPSCRWRSPQVKDGERSHCGLLSPLLDTLDGSALQPPKRTAASSPPRPGGVNPPRLSQGPWGAPPTVLSPHNSNSSFRLDSDSPAPLLGTVN